MSDLDPNMKDFQVGDIITAYHKGYWRLVEIKRRFVTDELKHYGYKQPVGTEYSPLFRYTQLMTADFKKKTGKQIKECDAGFCKKVDKTEIEKMKQAYCNGCDELIKLL